MLTKGDLLEAFKQLTDCCYHIWNWKFDIDFNVIESDCPHEHLYKSLLLENGRKEAIEEHMSQGTLPIICSIPPMLSWVIVFEKNEDDISTIYMKGPFFNGYNDYKSYESILKSFQLTQDEHNVMLKSLKKLPMITSSTVMQIAIMLHYAVNSERLLVTEVAMYTSEVVGKKYRGKILVDQFQNTATSWDVEQELLDKIRRGDENIGEVMTRATTMLSGIYHGDKKSLEFFRQNIHLLITLVSRAAVEGGMPRKSSFSLCADYRRILNKCKSVGDMENLSNDMLIDYVKRVKRMKEYANCSKHIRLCCEYIDTHTEEKISLVYMAERVGYTEYHLSRKFRQEVGCSIIDYIQKSKIQHAKYLLLNTKNTIEEISSSLGFSSPSYFSGIFKKHIGESPSNYRNNHGII